MALQGSPRKLLSYLIIKIVKYLWQSYLKTESPKSKKTESQISSDTSEIDFDDETLRRRVATYQANIKINRRLFQN